MSTDYGSRITEKIEEAWEDNQWADDLSQDWVNPDPEPAGQSDDSARTIIEPCTISYRTYFHEHTGTQRLVAFIVNDFPLDDPKYVLCDWYDPIFSQRQHKIRIPGTDVEYTSHSVRVV